MLMVSSVGYDSRLHTAVSVAEGGDAESKITNDSLFPLHWSSQFSLSDKLA